MANVLRHRASDGRGSRKPAVTIRRSRSAAGALRSGLDLFARASAERRGITANATGPRLAARDLGATPTWRTGSWTRRQRFRRSRSSPRRRTQAQSQPGTGARNTAAAGRPTTVNPTVRANSKSNPDHPRVASREQGPEGLGPGYRDRAAGSRRLVMSASRARMGSARGGGTVTPTTRPGARRSSRSQSIGRSSGSMAGEPSSRERPRPRPPSEGHSRRFNDSPAGIASGAT